MFTSLVLDPLLLQTVVEGRPFAPQGLELRLELGYLSKIAALFAQTRAEFDDLATEACDLVLRRLELLLDSSDLSDMGAIDQLQPTLGILGDSYQVAL
ncbi:MAG: hypothetical protein AAGC55_23385 [Myxococcota bacterium]